MLRKVFFVLVAFALSFAAVQPVFASDGGGAVYLMTNAASGNQVLVYHRTGDGSLSFVAAFATGGLGSGPGATVPPDPLGSQNSVLLSPDGNWLLAVNAGSNDISLFRVSGDALILTSRVGSGGVYPVSLTIHNDLVYALNAAGDGSISGFRLDDGALSPIPFSTRSLYAATPAKGSQPNILEAPAQVGFTPSGAQIVITDKGGVSGKGRILVFQVAPNGRPSQAFAATPTAAPVPFSFVFDRYGHLVVVDASAGTISSYAIQPDGMASLVGAAANGQAAVCWIATNGAYLFSDNTGSGTISALRPSASGAPVLLQVAAATTGPGTLPLDIGVSRDGQFLYSFEAGAGAIGEYRINLDGTLSLVGTMNGIPAIAGYQGIAVR